MDLLKKGRLDDWPPSTSAWGVSNRTVAQLWVLEQKGHDLSSTEGQHETLFSWRRQTGLKLSLVTNQF